MTINLELTPRMIYDTAKLIHLGFDGEEFSLSKCIYAGERDDILFGCVEYILDCEQYIPETEIINSIALYVDVFNATATVDIYSDEGRYEDIEVNYDYIIRYNPCEY